jgi:hypothetical protein
MTFPNLRLVKIDIPDRLEHDAYVTSRIDRTALQKPTPAARIAMCTPGVIVTVATLGAAP